MNKSIHKSIEFQKTQQHTFNFPEICSRFFPQVPEKYSGGTCKEADNCLLTLAERLPYLYTKLVQLLGLMFYIPQVQD